MGALKEEEQRNNTLATTPQIDIESEKEKPDESWVPKVESDSENIVTNGTKEDYEEEEVDMESSHTNDESEHGVFQVLDASHKTRGDIDQDVFSSIGRSGKRRDHSL